MADEVRQLIGARSQWPLRFCQGLSLFAVQGAVVLAMYAAMGAGTAPEDLPVGLQLDPRHGVLHLFIGLAALAVALAWRAAALRLVQAFAVLYIGLAFFGTFTDINFGMELALPENALHWTLGLLAALVAYASPRAPGRAEPLTS